MEDQDSSAARLAPYAARRSKTARVARDRRQQTLHKFMVRSGLTSRDLLVYLSIERYKRRTPEQNSAAAKKSSIVAALKRKYCDHMRRAPKKRASGQYAGKWCCPSCMEPVDAEILAAWHKKSAPDDDLVV